MILFVLTNGAGAGERNCALSRLITTTLDIDMSRVSNRRVSKSKERSSRSCFVVSWGLLIQYLFQQKSAGRAVSLLSGLQYGVKLVGAVTVQLQMN